MRYIRRHFILGRPIDPLTVYGFAPMNLHPFEKSIADVAHSFFRPAPRCIDPFRFFWGEGKWAA